MPRHLSLLWKENRYEIGQDLLGRLVIDPNFLDTVIIGGECWVYLNTIRRLNGKVKNYTNKFHRPNKAHMKRSKGDTRGIAHKDILPLAQIINLQRRLRTTTKMGPANPKRDSCTTITSLLTLHFPFESFWRNKFT